MVYPISVKIKCHTSQPLAPPLIVVLGHLFPIVGRELPVLSFCRELIWRRAGLPMEVKIRWGLPYVAAFRTHANRDVTFKHYAFIPGIIVHLGQLCMQDKLGKIIKSDILVGLALFIGQHFPVFFIPSRIPPHFLKSAVPVSSRKKAYFA